MGALPDIEVGRTTRASVAADPDALLLWVVGALSQVQLLPKVGYMHRAALPGARTPERDAQAVHVPHCGPQADS